MLLKMIALALEFFSFFSEPSEVVPPSPTSLRFSCFEQLKTVHLPHDLLLLHGFLLLCGNDVCIWFFSLFLICYLHVPYFTDCLSSPYDTSDVIYIVVMLPSLPLLSPLEQSLPSLSPHLIFYFLYRLFNASLIDSSTTFSTALMLRESVEKTH